GVRSFITCGKGHCARPRRHLVGVVAVDGGPTTARNLRPCIGRSVITTDRTGSQCRLSGPCGATRPTTRYTTPQNTHTATEGRSVAVGAPGRNRAYTAPVLRFRESPHLP